MIEYKNKFGLIPKKITDKTIGKIKILESNDKILDIFIESKELILMIDLKKKSFNIDFIGAN